MNDNESETLVVKGSEDLNKISPTQIIEKSAFDKYLCCCCDSAYDLTIKEYNLFEKLKKETIILYDETNNEHEKSLNELFEHGTELFKNENINEDEIWRRLGFQNNNPRTDFRAGGIYSVFFMNYFMRNFNSEVIEILKLKYFSFAVVCIRITFLVRLFLFLSKKSEIKKQQISNKISGCSRKQLKTFSKLLCNDNIIFLDILSYILIFVKQKFMIEMEEKKKELNFLLIDPITNIGISCLGNALNNSTAQKNESLINLLQIEFKKEYPNKIKI